METYDDETIDQSVDFMSDALMCGRPFRTFNVVDDFNREALAIEIDLNLPVPRVIRVLERVLLFHCYPEMLRVDRFNRTYRDELLDLYLFRTVGEVRQMTEQWRARYNNERAHDSLNDMTPVEYLQANDQTGNSNLAWD